MKFLSKFALLSVLIVPVENKDNFLNLKYSKLEPNKVSLKDAIVINVNKSASPLFYKVDPPREIESIKIKGSIDVQDKISDFDNDSYFQLGIIYEGDYRPSWLVKKVLPEWLLKVLSISDKYGVGRIDFHEASTQGQKLDKEDSIRDIKMKFITNSYIKDSKIEMDIKPKSQKILGFWLRSDGDESKAKFTTKLEQIEISE